MTLDHEPLPIHQKRELILLRSPFLKTFLEPTGPSNPLTWLPRLDLERDRLSAEFKDSIDLNWEWKIAAPLTTMAGYFDTLRKDLSKEVMVGTIVQILLMGYEIGDTDEVLMFSSDIVSQLHLMNILNYEPGKPLPQGIFKMVNAILSVGVYFKITGGGESSSLIPEQFWSTLEELGF